MKRMALHVVAVLGVSLAMAATFVRVPALWRLMPNWVTEALFKTSDFTSQEQVANMEFLLAWVLSLVVLGGGYAVVSGLRHRH
jgi:hypothetical protein